MRPSREWALPFVAAAVVAAAFALPGQSKDNHRPRTVTVTQSSYACPVAKGTSIATGGLASHAGSRTTARSVLDRLPIAALGSTTAWGEGSLDAGALLVNAVDPQGAGAVGFTAQTPSKKTGGGLAAGQCPGVVQDAWFLGAGSGAKHFTTVTLTNLSDSPAVADVMLWGQNGRIDAIDAKGIVLTPLQTKDVRLESLAAGEPELAVQVHSRRGAMSIAARDTSTAVFAGTEPIPTTTEPARSQILPGIAADTSRKQLLLLNPGDTTARVKVEALGKDGALVPTGLDDLKVSAGKVTVLDLPKSAGNGPLALRLTSDFPLSATVRMAQSNKDFAYAVAGPLLDGPAIMPMSVKGLLKDARVIVTAPKAKATVTVTAFGKDMKEQGSTTLSLKADSTGSLDLGKKKLFRIAPGKIAYFVVTSLGDVAGSAIYTNGSGLSAIPLRAVPLKTLAPYVRPGH